MKACSLMKNLAHCLLLFAMFTLTGCGSDGPDLAPAGGVVKIDGKETEQVSVTFIYPEGTMASGITDASGRFNLSTNGKPGAPVGKAKVVFSKVTSGYGGGTSAKPEDMMKMMQSKGKDAKSIAAKQAIPTRYSSADSTDKEADVKSGDKNDFTFDLVSK